MALSPIFKIRQHATPELLELLSNTTLGTNGAKYKHLDTSSRILEADDPMFLSMERTTKVLGNITFCRRGDFWYIRYFAFSSFLQAGTTKKQEDKSNSFLKRELNTFFNEVFDGKQGEQQVHSMYAYIDPHNDRSKWMSENFGFKTIAHLATQTFSRVSPKPSHRLESINDWEEISVLVKKNYGDHQYFFTTHAKNPPFYVLRNEQAEIVACTRVTKVNWEIVRLPGKLGGILTKLLPYIPVLKRLIKPKKHTFLVPEVVCAKNNDPQLVDELFSAILAEEKLNLMIWWIDITDPIYEAVKDQVNWGIINKIAGVTPVDVVQRTATGEPIFSDRPVFVTAFDMV